jgi:class 3 adenylate cyclase
MRFSIRRKLFLLLVGLTAAVLLVVLYSVRQNIEAEIRHKVFEDFGRTKNVFKKENALRYNLLDVSATLIGENSTFKGNIALYDPPTAYQILEEFSYHFTEDQLDLFIATDRKGAVLARLGDEERYGDELTQRSSVRRALQGDYRAIPDDGELWPELWHLDKHLYQIATVPLWLGDGSIIGTITLGAKIDALEDEQQRHILEFRRQYQDQIDKILQEMDASQPFEGVLGAEEVFAFISPLGSGEPAYYIATVDKARELEILTTLQDRISLIAGISVVITILLAIILGRTLSRPILRLVEGMDRVRQGDLQVEVRPTTHDEVGLLAGAFNEMIVGLRERLQLTRYVGAHTLDMIQLTSDSGEIALGGSRRELAVMFTDIRGFTAYSENRAPEEVIAMVNRYLGFQAEIVPQYEGSIDKFVGDEMVALFIGARALERAIDCAVAIQQRVRREHEDDPVPVDIGIGINYGPVILGNMGAENRLDYTVIGAEVNLGARLCSAAKPGEILIRRELLDGVEVEVEVVGTQMMSFKGVSNELEIAALSSA